MTDRLAEVNGRIASAQQIASVVAVMRATAATRSRDARKRLDSVRGYAQSIGHAIGRALPLSVAPTPARGPTGGGPRLVVAIGAEQGFAGGFSRSVLDAAVTSDEGSRPEHLLLLGERALLLARERGLQPDWSAPMAAHLEQIEAIADRVADQIWERVARGAARVLLVYATLQGDRNIVSRSLVPFDFARFPRLRGAPPPLAHLPADALLASLAEEYVFAEVCEALTLSYAAENEARMRAMTAARSHVADILEDLNRQARQLRQSEITTEIVELAAGRRA